MVDLDRRPTAHQMEELIDAARRDPSAAFVQLGEAYLALGRPKDVLEVCHVGLAQSPDNIEGRVLLARAFFALHQWKEAQAELLRVVKVDRSNGPGFALLGEVLLRRGDIERAVPVLQHAQNLDPTSSQILIMLKRARSGEPLDPPQPVPIPVLPRDIAVVQASAPTRIGPAMVFPEPVAAAKPRPAAASNVPVPSIDGVRPRLVSGHKPKNAAAAALRQSAAVGENYLNELLTGGLLDVAGVRIPDVQYDLRPDRRWGRSARRSFVVLFLLLFMGLGGGGAWYFWTERQKVVAVARLQRDAKEQGADGSYAGLEAALASLGSALGKDNDNTLTMAYVAEAAGLQALLYGTDVIPAERAIKGAASEIKEPAELGYRELLIGRAAAKLAQVADARAQTTMLYEAIDLLDGYLATRQDDRWARWLKGRALLIAGERKAGFAMIRQAAGGDGGLIVAKIDVADLTSDDGEFDKAIELYDEVEKLSKDHPLVVLGKALARAENDIDNAVAIDELNVKLDKPLGPRVAAYRGLALAFAHIDVEDYPRAKEAAAGSEVSEARFQARRAWLQLQLGNIEAARNARALVLWYGKKNAEPDPGAILIDVGLEVAAGLGAIALEHAVQIKDLRGRRLAAWALIDLDRPREALVEIEKVLAKAPESVEAKALRDYAKTVSGSAKEREEGVASLDKLARNANSKATRHLLGKALVRIGKVQEGQAELEQALVDISDEHPHPIEYRTRTALAELQIAQGKLADASKEIAEALKINPGFFPAFGVQAQLQLKAGKPDAAYASLQPIVEKSLTPSIALPWAESLATRKGSTAKDKQRAAEILLKLKADSPSVSAAELARIATLFDPILAETFVPAKKAKPAPRRRRGR